MKSSRRLSMLLLLQSAERRWNQAEPPQVHLAIVAHHETARC